jgi:hypothetical protein
MKTIMHVAKKHGLGVKQSATGVTIVQFPKVNDMTPILVTADNFSWCPEAMTGDKMRWEGKRCLNANELEQEIRAMYHGLMLLDPSKMIQVAHDLCTETLGKKSS